MLSNLDNWFQIGPSKELPQNYSAILGFIGSILVTIGDTIGTIAAAIDLKQAEIEAIQQEQDQQDNKKVIEKMQIQIDDMQKELKYLRDRKNI